MKKGFKYLFSILGLGLLIFAAGCSKSNQSSNKPKEVLSGVYKISTKDGKADDGSAQPSYWYFDKNGELMNCTPETKDYYGSAMRGTWRSLGNHRFQIKMHDIYDDDYYTTNSRLDGNTFYTYDNSKNAKYSWSADTNYKQSQMTRSDYMDMFDKAKESDQKKIQDNGYDKPDNESTTSSGSQMTFDQAARLVQKGNFSDFHYDEAVQTHDGSHPTDNGGYLLITYPGAKGQDHFTITKTGNHKYHIEAVYGSSDGGFTPGPQGPGPMSADVTD